MSRTQERVVVVAAVAERLLKGSNPSKFAHFTDRNCILINTENEGFFVVVESRQSHEWILKGRNSI